MIVSSTFINNVNAQSYGQTGDVDTDTTNNNTCYSFSYNMRKGSRDSTANNEVTKLQEALIQLGYLSQDPSGYFGVATYNAVKSFQSAKGLLSSGFVGTYTRAALQTATCNTPNPNPTPHPIDINLTPSSLPSVLNDQDSNGQKLRGINLVDDINNLLGIPSNGVSITNTNIPSVSVTLSACSGVYGTSISGPVYANYSRGLCNLSKNFISVLLANSTLNDGQYYYFTIRVSQHGRYTDKQYNFTYKKVISNVCAYGYNNTYGWCDTNNNYNNNVNNCTTGYMNGTYGCYYNVTCSSTYDYNRGYYVNNCKYLNGFDGFIDKRNYDVNTNYNNSSGYYNGTNILY